MSCSIVGCDKVVLPTVSYCREHYSDYCSNLDAYENLILTDNEEDVYCCIAHDCVHRAITNLGFCHEHLIRAIISDRIRRQFVLYDELTPEKVMRITECVHKEIDNIV